MCQDNAFRSCVALITDTTLLWHEALAMSQKLRDAILLSIRLNQGARVDWKKGEMDWPSLEEQMAIAERRGKTIR